MFNRHTRRRFLKTTALTVGFPTIIPSSVLGKNGKVAPSNRIVMGGIGIGPRGRIVLKHFLESPEIQFVAIADAQEERREIVRRTVNRKYGNEDCYKCVDMHEILERDDIDAVQITTGDRWHALATIYAAKAGKDAYVEKPCSMTIAETQELADAINRYGIVFQAGTQRRNVDHFKFCCDVARSGKLGNIQKVHASIVALKPDAEWREAQPLPDPELIDWDRWLGPAPWRPYNKDYVRGGWRGHFDFHGGASIPEWGAHTVDICQLAAGTDDTTPVEYEPQGDQIHCKYADGKELILRPAGFKGEGNWVVPGTCPVRFEGDQGWLETADFGESKASNDEFLKGHPEKVMAGTDASKHVEEFIRCVKTREKTTSNADVMRTGHIISHAAAIAWQLGRKVKFDPKTEVFVDDVEANRMCSRARREPYHM